MPPGTRPVPADLKEVLPLVENINLPPPNVPLPAPIAPIHAVQPLAPVHIHHVPPAPVYPAPVPFAPVAVGPVAVGPPPLSGGAILVLFILLAIVARMVLPRLKC